MAKGIRKTIYVKEPKREKLLIWAKEYTGTDNLSEALFISLQLLKDSVNRGKQKQKAKKALATSRGIWADVPEMDEIMKEIREGWEHWQASTS